MLTLSTYALVAINRDSALSSEAAMKYFVLGALASGMLLYGMSMIYGATGTLDLKQIQAAATFAAGDVQQHQALLAFGLVFLVVGIGFKFGVAPFHMWIPDVYQGAPDGGDPVHRHDPEDCGIRHGLPVARRRAERNGEPLARDACRACGCVARDRQHRRDRADEPQAHARVFDDLAHGFLLMGLLNGTPSGYAAAMFYAIAYAITASVAFGGILLLARAGFEAEEIDDFKGLNQRNPWYALVMLLAMASLAGVPPLFGFFAKLLVLKAALDAGMLWVVIVAIVMAIVGAYYYLRVIKVMYFDVADDKSPLLLPSDCAVPLAAIVEWRGPARAGPVLGAADRLVLPRVWDTLKQYQP
jgi:NADH-quinone oxidoreductase subunit N